MLMAVPADMHYTNSRARRTHSLQNWGTEGRQQLFFVYLTTGHSSEGLWGVGVKWHLQLEERLVCHPAFAGQGRAVCRRGSHIKHTAVVKLGGKAVRNRVERLFFGSK